MEKTIEEKLNTILAFSREKASESDYTPIGGLKFYACPTEGLASILLFGRAFFLDKSAVGNPAVADKINIIYLMLLGLDKRDALEAERAFWIASTDSLTKSLEAEKVKNANGGEFKDMLQQVLNHSNRPEMDDAQFRMFARENINHLLYGNKEGKKDEN